VDGRDNPGHDVTPDQLPCSRSLTVEDSTFVHPTHRAVPFANTTQVTWRAKPRTLQSDNEIAYSTGGDPLGASSRNVRDSAECSMNPRLATQLTMAALPLAVGPAAQAADLNASNGKAPPQHFDWRDFYLGGNLGGAFSEEK
jgi:hypothetical protein